MAEWVVGKQYRVVFRLEWAEKDRVWAYYATSEEAEANLEEPAQTYFGVTRSWVEHLENGEWREVKIE